MGTRQSATSAARSRSPRPHTTNPRQLALRQALAAVDNALVTAEQVMAKLETDKSCVDSETAELLATSSAATRASACS